MSDDQVAVKVNQVSKVYRLWNSPKERLAFPVKRLINSLSFDKKKFDTNTSFREFYALNNISLEIKKGESWGFVGVNGSGKSTLLKIISGNLRPSSGSVEVNGKVAILDYGSGFNGDFTGKENIYLKATLLGLTRKQIQERFNSIIEFAELGDFINQPVKTYSSGMTARLGFAIMAHVDADIIITDEALAVGDVFFVQKCMQFIRSFLKKGTFLFVSHSTNDVLSLCQKAVWLDHGNMKLVGSASAVTQAYLDENTFGRQEISSDEILSTPQNKVNEVLLGQPNLSKLMNYVEPKIFKDSRIQHSHLRNDIHIPEFEFAGGVAIGGAKITKVSLADEQGTPFSWMIGGELVTLTIEILAEQDLKNPIIGFQVLDRLGQSLFADTSFLITQEQIVYVKANTIFTAEFKFHMPLFPVGDYVIRAAIAVGEDEGSATMLQTIDNALVFRSLTSGARHGLIGVPMQSITLKNKNDEVPSIEMAAKNGDLNLLQYLHEQGSDIYANENHCLKVAAGAGYLEIVRYLHEHGACLHDCDAEVIRSILSKGHWEVLTYLFNHGYKVQREMLQDDIKLNFFASQDNCIMSIAKSHLVTSLNHPTYDLLPDAGQRWKTYSLWSRIVIPHLQSPIDAIRFAQDAQGHGGFESRQKNIDLSLYVDGLESHLAARFPHLKNKFLSFTEPEISDDSTSCILNGRRVSGPMFANVTFFLECVTRIPNLDTVCEIGGGYGGPCRLWLTNTIHRPTRYFIIDLPESLFFSEVFLRTELGEDKVYYVNSEDELKEEILDRFNIILCPINFIASIRNIKFDLVYNTLSMQEMSEDYIDFYFKWLDQQCIRYFYSFNYAAQSPDEHPESANNCSPLLSRYWHPVWLAYYAAGPCPAMHILVEKKIGETESEIVDRGKKLFDLYISMTCDRLVFLNLLISARMINDASVSCLIIEKSFKEMNYLPRELWSLLKLIKTQKGADSLDLHQQNIIQEVTKALDQYQSIEGKSSPFLDNLYEPNLNLVPFESAPPSPSTSEVQQQSV